VYIFDGNLETIKTSGLGYGDFGSKVCTQVFVDDAV